MSETNHEMHYDPNGVGIKNGNIFGLPYRFEESEIVILPIPWDVTTSYIDGTSRAPKRILDASSQLDLFHLHIPNAWKKKIHMLPVSKEWIHKNNEMRVHAREVIRMQEHGKPIDTIQEEISNINHACNMLRKWTLEQTRHLLDQEKKVILLGGDHSTPLGYIQTLSLKYSAFGILQIDAHADLRTSYEGFTYSHASIMHHALQLDSVKKLVQVGIRDVCEAEVKKIEDDDRIACFFDPKCKEEQFEGKTWKEQVDEIVHQLPDCIYVSVDVDGLTPSLCPNTGTPVPGGLSFNEVLFLFQRIRESNKKVIGADLCEVGNAEWDANVGARLLWELVNM